MENDLFNAIKWATVLVRKNFNLEDMSVLDKHHIKVLNTALQNMERGRPVESHDKHAPDLEHNGRRNATELNCEKNTIFKGS